MPDLESANALILKNLPLASFFAKKYQWTNVEWDELVSLANLAIVRAAHTYIPERGEFSTWVAKHMRTKISHLRQYRGLRAGRMFELAVDKDGNQYDVEDRRPSSEEAVDARDVVLRLMPHLDESERWILASKYAEGRTLAEIAASRGRSGQWASWFEQKTLKKCRRILRLEAA